MAESVRLRNRLTRLPARLADEWRRFSAASWASRIRRLREFAATLLLLLPAWLLAIGLRFCNRFIRPVRIGSLAPKGRISTMTSYIEPYVRELRLHGPVDAVVIVLNPGQCPNAQLTRMYKRAIWLLDDEQPWLRALVGVAYRFFLLGSPLDAGLHAAYEYRFADAWGLGEPVMRLTPQDEEAGRRLLAARGIPAGTSYICVGLRESAYYQQFLTPEARIRARGMNIEAGEDTYVRNPPLANYLPMLVRCATQGLCVLRMGQKAGEPLPAGLPPSIIDYAAHHRTPFGDIYLLGTCKFLVAGAAGLWNIASSFNRPVVYTDSYCLETRGVRPGDLFIPKKLWLVAEKRFLTFREMLKAHTRYAYASNCRRDGVELVHNTPEEITAVVQEMIQRLDGTWQTTDQDEELQRRFDALYQPGHVGYRMPGRIGTEFLRQHVVLLD